MNEKRTQAKATPEEYLQFLMEVLQVTSESRGDPAVIFPLLQENLEYLDEHFAELLHTWASYILSKTDEREAFKIAVDIGKFSNLIKDFSLGRLADKQEIEIAGYEVIATVFGREKDLKNWAAIQNSLGIAYCKRIRKEEADNREKAISAYKNALQVFKTHDAFREQWANTQANLGTAYLERILGNKENDIAILNEL